MKESKLQRYLIVEIAKLDGEAEKVVAVGKRGRPDLEVNWAADSDQADTILVGACTGCEPAIEFIETKARGGKLSVLQQRDHAKRRSRGFLVHVIWSMEQAEIYLRSRGKK